LKIGIMLRHYNQHGGGVKVYTLGLLEKLLSNCLSNEYILLYNDPRLIGTYESYPHVKELALSVRSKIIWDQWAVKRAVEKEKIDLLFNPKYALPLMGNCKGVFVCHGMDWYVMPWGSKFTDRINHRFLMPRYAKKADTIIAVSNTAREHAMAFLKVPPDRIHTVYLGIDERFKHTIEPHELERIKEKYRLPDEYYLYVGQIYPPKNFGRLLRAYAKVGPSLKIPLVIAGEHRWLSGHELALIDKLNISSWVLRPGWIGREELPAFYVLATALLLPSLYEACPSPPIEAMASGCPVLTSNRGGTKEIASNAALLVDPEDVESIANGMEQIITDSDLRARLIPAGRKRAGQFSWEKCARETIAILMNA
jgi:glycosyltransferase involved in cell wall biosynthesis